MSADELYVEAPGQNYTGRGCPVLTKDIHGDKTIELSVNWRPGLDTLPAALALGTANDSLGPVQTGRFTDADLPQIGCFGAARLTFSGLAQSLGDKKFQSQTTFGPSWNQVTIGGSNGVDILTVGQAVAFAIGELGGNVEIGTIDATAFPIARSERFLGRSGQDVANWAAAQGAGLATPLIWSVDQRVFNWAPLDLAPAYRVKIADGVLVKPRYTTSRLYNRVIVIWGKDQTAVWPNGELSYDRIPTEVDLVLNAGSEIADYPAALALAQGCFARLETIELAWSCEITIPFSAGIEQVGVTPRMAPWRGHAARFVEVADLESGAFGPDHAIPMLQLVTEWRWDGPGNRTVLSTGEIRDPSQVIRSTMAAGAGSRLVQSVAQPGLSIPQRNIYEIMAGPSLPTGSSVASSGSSTPPRIDYGAVAIDTKHETLHPSVLPPLPPPIVIILPDANEEGDDAPVPCPPMQVLGWEVHADVALTTTISLRLVSTGEEILQVNLAAAKTNKKTFTADDLAKNQKLKIMKDDGVLPHVLVADGTPTKFISIFLRPQRVFADYTPGGDGPQTPGIAAA